MNTISFWKHLSEGFPKQLPSGATVTVRTFALEEYLSLGRIPNELQQVALAVFMTGGLEQSDDESVVGKNVKFVNYVVAKCLVEPVARLERKKVGDGEIYVKDIPWGDRLQIYLAAISPQKVKLDFLSKTTTSSDASTSSPNATDNGPQAS